MKCERLQDRGQQFILEFLPEVEQRKQSDGKHNFYRTKIFGKTRYSKVNDKEVRSKSVNSKGNSVIETFSFLNLMFSLWRVRVSRNELVCILHFRKKSIIAEKSEQSHNHQCSV